jgi:phage terminase large subunit
MAGKANNKPRQDPKVEWNPKQIDGVKLLSDFTKKFILFFGGSRSGKTFLAVYFILYRARHFAGSKHLIARYSFANAKKTIWLQTILPLARKDEKLGLCRINENEGIIKYNNGSLVVLGGLEPSRIDSVLAAEYATIFITEANENKYNHIEPLLSRLNDTAKDEDGNPISLKFICDLNPTVKNNWTNVLFRMGMDPITGNPKEDFHRYAHLHFQPEDNEANLAEGYIETLRAMSPALKKRFYFGEYGEYEGLVYHLDEEVHIVDDFEIPADWKRFRGIDFGYHPHPFCCLWAAYDASNDILYFYREHYLGQTTVRRHSEIIKAMTGDEHISWTVADHDAEDRATLLENGIVTVPADKEVLKGIDHVADLLHFDENKTRPNIKIFRSCKALITEFYAYKWADPATRMAKDREVVKEDDHGPDVVRYMSLRVFPILRSPGVIMQKGYKEKAAKAMVSDREQFQQEIEKIKRRVPGVIRGRS